MRVCKTRMFSVKLNVCICVSMSELKEDRLVLTYKCMCMCISKENVRLGSLILVRRITGRVS